MMGGVGLSQRKMAYSMDVVLFVYRISIKEVKRCIQGYVRIFGGCRQM
jgi:hypothetical protein